MFHGFEDGFGVGVVVGDAGSGQGSGDAESLVEVACALVGLARASDIRLAGHGESVNTSGPAYQ